MLGHGRGPGKGGGGGGGGSGVLPGRVGGCGGWIRGWLLTWTPPDPCAYNTINKKLAPFVEDPSPDPLLMILRAAIVG